MAAIERKTDTWGSRFGFIMAAVGSSVGLGNFWRFPYTAGENGGGAFIVLYLFCVVLVGLPLLMAEYAVGRKSGRSAIEGVETLAEYEGKSRSWGVVGWIGSFTSFFILSFYLVISVWIIAFLLQAPTGHFSGMDAAASGENFMNTIGQGDNALARKWGILGLLALLLAANVWVVGRGVKGGIERAASILMPAFFLMLLAVVAYAVTQGDLGRTVAFLFEPKWEDVSFKTFLSALGQAFFSIGIGLALMMTYGAYLDRETNIPRSSVIVVSSDSLVALIAGFAVFPIVFMAGLDPAGGPGLFFVSMPVAFGAVPGGALFATVFFALALFAAFTSSISLMEVCVSWLEERHGVTRFGASLGIGFVMWMIGAAHVFSLDYLDFLDFMTEGLLLPLSGLMVALFAGWAVRRETLTSELGDGRLMDIWRLLIRWFVPAFVAFVLVFGFLDKIQDQYQVPLPGFLLPLLGPNA